MYDPCLGGVTPFWTYFQEFYAPTTPLRTLKERRYFNGILGDFLLIFLDFEVILTYFANTPLYAPKNFQITPFWTYLGPHFYGNTVYVNTIIIALDIDVSFLVFIKLTRFLVFNKRNFRFLVLKKRVSFLLFKKRVSYLVLKMPDRNLYPNKLKY